LVLEDGLVAVFAFADANDRWLTAAMLLLSFSTTCTPQGC
jgi:hypothetical protein